MARRRRRPSRRPSPRSGSRRLRQPRLPWFTGKPYALYAHVRAVTTHGATAVEQPVRIQHALGASFPSRWRRSPARPLGAGRRRDRVPGLVPGHPQGRSDAHERRRPARALQLPPEDNWWSLVRWRVRAGAPGRRRAPERPARSLLRAWSPTYATTNPALVDRQAAARAAQCPTWSASGGRTARISSCPRYLHR